MQVGVPLALPALPAIPPALVAGAVAVGAVLVGLLPTCLYLYVEPRSRVQWGDKAGPRRAPAVACVAAWSSFFVGQLAAPCLLVPVACVGLAYVQIQLGVARPVGLVATAALGALALVQAVLAVGLIPAGVRLLMNDARTFGRLKARARQRALASLAIGGTATALGWSMASLPGLVHPWLRAALVWTALRPVELFAALSLLQALLLWRAAHARVGRDSIPGGPSGDR